MILVSDFKHLILNYVNTSLKLWSKSEAIYIHHSSRFGCLFLCFWVWKSAPTLPPGPPLRNRMDRSDRHGKVLTYPWIHVMLSRMIIKLAKVSNAKWKNINIQYLAQIMPLVYYKIISMWFYNYPSSTPYDILGRMFKLKL